MKNAVRTRPSALAISVSAALFAVSGCTPDAPPEKAHADKAAVTPTATSGPAERIVYRDRIVYVDRPVAGSAGPTTSPVIATVGRPGHEIEVRQSDIQPHVMRTAGLDVTLYVLRVRLCEEELKQRKLPPVTDADVEDEILLTLADRYPQVTKSDVPSLVQQIARTMNLSRDEFDLAMRANAHLRRIAETLVPTFTDAMLQDAFLYQYGEKVQVSDIAVANLVEMAEVQKMLKDGQSFADVAKAKSKDPASAPMGGQVPPFSKGVKDVSQIFKDMAFSLKEGETSDPFQDREFYHIVRCDKRIPPENVKFEDVKEKLSRSLHDRIVATAMRGFLDQLGQQTMATIKLVDPELAAEFKRREDALAAAQGPTTRHLEAEGKAQETLQTLREMVEAKHRAATQPTTKPAP